MKEQVHELNLRGIPAAYLSSEFDDEQEELIYQNLKMKNISCFMFPRKDYPTGIFLENIADAKISLIAVDEAHCISEWVVIFARVIRI